MKHTQRVRELFGREGACPPDKENLCNKELMWASVSLSRPIEAVDQLIQQRRSNFTLCGSHHVLGTIHSRENGEGVCRTM